MLMKTAVTALLGLAITTEAASVHHYRTPTLLGRRQNRGGGRGGGNNGGLGNAFQGNAGQGNAGQGNAGQGNNGAAATCLAADAIQTGSQSTGQNGATAADGQVNSATCVLYILYKSLFCPS